MHKKQSIHKFSLRTIITLSLSAGLLFAGAWAYSKPDKSGATNLRPVIGVFSQQTSTISNSSTIDPDVQAVLMEYKYMIPVSYVEWVG